VNAMHETSQLLALLQLNDSAFPSGAFTHSYGLEQLVRQVVVRDTRDVELFVTSVLTHTIATSEAAAARYATEAAAAGDLDAVIAVDQSLYAMKPAVELRDASLKTGRRFLEEVAIHVEAPTLNAYRERVTADERIGNYAVAFGVVAAAHGIESRYVPAAVMLSAATAMLQAAMRLMRVSHRDVQAILHRLRPLIARMAADVRRGGHPVALSGFHPLQDIASMRHARAEARLFAS
jgi:urease accessory protein